MNQVPMNQAAVSDFTFASCLSAALVADEASNLKIGSSCAGLVAGTLGRGNFSLISLLSELGTLRVHFSWRRFGVVSERLNA